MIGTALFIAACLLPVIMATVAMARGQKQWADAWINQKPRFTPVDELYEIELKEAA